MLLFQINPVSHVPAYRQVMEQVKYSIAAGTLRAGDRLPSIRELARSLALNPTTIVKAYGELAHEGVIQMQHGRGVFVSAAAGATGGLSQQEQAEALRALARQLAVEARQLGAPREVVDRVVKEAWEELQPREKDDDADVRD